MGKTLSKRLKCFFLLVLFKNPINCSALYFAFSLLMIFDVLRKQNCISSYDSREITLFTGQFISVYTFLVMGRREHLSCNQTSCLKQSNVIQKYFYYQSFGQVTFYYTKLKFNYLYVHLVIIRLIFFPSLFSLYFRALYSRLYIPVFSYLLHFICIICCRYMCLSKLYVNYTFFAVYTHLNNYILQH